MGKIPPAMMDMYKKAGKVGKAGAVGKGQKAPPFFESAKEEKAEGLKGAAAKREEKAEMKGAKSSPKKGKFPAFLKKK